jgi:hypothetical protein
MQVKKHVLLVVFTCPVIASLAQPLQSPAKSPKQVVEEFCKFETTGGRLTIEGWNKAAASFLKPTPAPTQKTILVTAKDFSVWDPAFRSDTRADVIVGVTGKIWKIDPQVKFSEYSSPTEVKTSLYYTVVLDNKHWELGPNGQAAKQVTGSPEWRIEGTNDSIWLTVESAIHYVTDVRNHTSDQTIKKNADRTLVSLKRLRP